MALSSTLIEKSLRWLPKMVPMFMHNPITIPISISVPSSGKSRKGIVSFLLEKPMSFAMLTIRDSNYYIFGAASECTRVKRA